MSAAMESAKANITYTTLHSHKSSAKFPILPSDWSLNERDICDLEMMLGGAFAPVHGYMCRENYYSVLNNMRLVSGEIWPMPIVLAIPKKASESNIHWLTYGHRELTPTSATSPTSSEQIIRLRDQLGSIVAELEVEDVYEPDIELEMQATLGTTDENHPHVKYLKENNTNCYYVGGKVRLLNPIQHFDFVEGRKSAIETKELLKQAGWDVIVGFQTRNPMHRSHYELTKRALKEVNLETGKKSRLLLTPAIGPTQPGDINYFIRVRSYKRLLERYEADSVKLILLPLAMRMAGPREAVWHAIIRRNYGCTHFIVGRDHAGPSTTKADGSSFYKPYEAHELLHSLKDEIGIIPVFGKAMVYAENTNGAGDYYVVDEVPKDHKVINISGTMLRSLFHRRQPVPEWFSFPEVINELEKFYVPRCESGLCIYFTGLPCSGKSSLAMALQASIRQHNSEKRNITLLDADIIRTHLSKGLGFSQSDRSINVRRIGYVASEIIKHKGICIVANIAPYEEDRQCNREIITKAGGYYVEIYVSTPLEVCEERDVKELYKKARQGIIKQFTGISDPYQVPEHSELVIDSSDDIAGKVNDIVAYLHENMYLPQ